MKAITIKQPFASLIREGYKEYEFRSWKTNFRGEVLIHAGKSIDKEAMGRFKKYNLDCPTGCIIAKVTITDCVEIDEKVKKELKEKNELVYRGAINHQGDKNEYGFKIENVEKIDPIYCKGALSFWEFDEKNLFNK